MPWEEVTIMAQRAVFIELALRERANMRALCREFGITPRTGYKWLKRFRDEGEAGLYDRSRRPKRSPRRSSARTEGAVLKVRSEHPAWGWAQDPMEVGATGHAARALGEHDHGHPASP